MNLNGKKILVFGLGVSGMGAVRFLAGKDLVLSAVNQGPPHSWNEYEEIKKLPGDIHLFAEDHPSVSELFNEVDLIVLSPGIPREHPLLAKTKAPIWSEVELAYHYCLAPIVAVTGTNGKTTTVSFLDHLFKALDKKVFTGGNIGTAFCDCARAIEKGEAFDFILLELSSFQLESIEKFKPQVACLLNIFPNHGERYTDHRDYARAKFNISKNMDKKGTLIYDSSNEVIESWAEEFIGIKAPIETSNSEGIIEHLLSMINLDQFKLPGLHNKINLDFCLEVLNALNLLEGNSEKVQEAINSFPGVSHRIEYVPSSEKFKVYNDAKSTNWDATITAINSMADFDDDLVLIMGGQLRGHNDLPPVAAEKPFRERVAKVLLIGESAPEIESKLSDWVPCFNKETIESAVEEVKQENFEGILLLSPGFPSFDQFSNYVERGNQFKSLFLKP